MRAVQPIPFNIKGKLLLPTENQTIEVPMTDKPKIKPSMFSESATNDYFNFGQSFTEVTSTGETKTISLEDIINIKKELEKPVRDLFARMGGDLDKHTLILHESVKALFIERGMCHSQIKFTKHIDSHKPMFINNDCIKRFSTDYHFKGFSIYE